MWVAEYLFLAINYFPSICNKCVSLSYYLNFIFIFFSPSAPLFGAGTVAGA